MCSEDRDTNLNENAAAEKGLQAITIHNERELQEALGRKQSNIILAEDFKVSETGFQITYEVEIIGNGHEITREASFLPPVFILEEKGQLILSDVIVDGNKENCRGAESLIWVKNGSLIVKGSSVLKNNHAKRHGGAVFLNEPNGRNSYFMMDDQAVIENCESDTYGGGIAVIFSNMETKSCVRMEGNSRIQNNGAKSGGAIAVIYHEAQNIGSQKGSFQLKGNTVISGNKALDCGGGVYFSNAIGADDAYRCGLPVSLRLEDTVQIINNMAEKNGGGIYFLSTNPKDNMVLSDKAVIKNNMAKNGAGIFSCIGNGGMDLELKGTICKNQAELYGGGVCYDQSLKGTVINNPVCKSQIHINGGTISGNEAGVDGGGISCVNTVEGSNAAVLFLMENGKISNNRAGECGGGIWRTGFGKFVMNLSSGVIGEVEELHSQNNYEGNTAGRSSGGGIFFKCKDQTAELIIAEGMVINGNYAGLHGGGVYIFDEGCMSVTLNGGEITQNTAAGNGGGIFYQAASTENVLKLRKGKIDNNDAYHGGGIYILNGNVAMEPKLTIRENAALQNGGGIAAAALQNGMLNGGIIEYNRAKYGGGLYLRDRSRIFGEQCYVQHNKAEKGGGIYNSESRIEFKDAFITENEAEKGGGIYNNGSSAVRADFHLKGKTCVLKNKSELTGGGIYNTNAASLLTLNDEVLIGLNAAGTDGGGIYNINNGIVSIHNQVKIGGEQENNTAGGLGKGFYNQAVLYLSGKPDIANGLYLTELDSCVKITDAITEGVIQLERMPYVLSSPDRKYVVIGQKGDSYNQLTQEDVKAFLKPGDGFSDWEIVVREAEGEIHLVATKERQQEQTAEQDEIAFMEVPQPDIVATAAAMPAVVTPVNSLVRKRRCRVSFCSPSDFLFPSYNMPAAFTVEAGEGFRLPYVVPGRRGHQFSGWRIRGEEPTRLYFPGDRIKTVSRNIMLCACWRVVLF